MTLKLRRGLWLWAGALMLALLFIMPLSGVTLALAALTTLCLVALGWIRSDRRVPHSSQAFNLNGCAVLPSATYRRPVVLVCGDGLVGLFGASPAEQLAVRTTAQGCYIRVPGLEQLATITAALQLLRPDWGGQLSVMLVVNPGEHTDHGELTGRVRAFCYQIALLRKRGMALPLLLVSYLQCADCEGPWFSWEDGQGAPSVRENGTCSSLSDWQREAGNGAMHAERLRGSIQLSSAAAWWNETVLPHLGFRDDLPLACALTLVPALPQSVIGNLWQQWLRDRTALGDERPAAALEGALLPFPDPLLPLLPTHLRNAPNIRAGVAGLWIAALAILTAMASSAWQNKLLLRQVTDDLRRYNAVSHPNHRDQPEFALLEEAVTVLRRDAIRLDNYYRQGEPLALGMGLYRGEHLRVPLLNILANHRQPPAAPAQMKPGNPVRLDSLSLFATGSARLKPESTKVLIEALVDIKAQPGWLILITGHTDATGSSEQNLQLSLARAAAVRDWMQLMGSLPDSCFAVQGLGSSQPVASNDTDSGRTANRRVDIRLVPEEGACTLLTAGARQTTPVAFRDIR
jgi:outer membrane protein OmpA-like peptidoglycan-associated protein